MIEKNFQPEEVAVLTDLEALKVISDPLRNQIMETLTPEPLTVGQIAGLLGLDNSKLYYHINLLEKHGFIRVVDTSQRGNLIEKHYWITAQNYHIDENMFNFNVDTVEGTEAISTLLLANVDATREDLARSLKARHHQIVGGAPQQPRPVVDYREVINISDQRALEFQARLKTLLEEFEETESDEDSGERQSWALGVFMYPRFYYPPSEEDNSEG
jgi:DNA-binding transcriptional ArsR family regulator